MVYCSVEGCSAELSRETITVDALNHDWNDATYSYAEDGTSCTVTRVCKNDGTHTETAEASISSQVKIPATCKDKGTTTYTATFNVDWAVPQTKVVENIPATGEHIYTKYETIGGDLETASCDYGCGATHTKVVENPATEGQVEVVAPKPEEGQTTTNVTLDTGVLADIKNKKVDLYLNSDLLELVFNNTAVGVIADKHKDNQNVSIVVEDKTAPVPEGQQPTNLVFDIHLAVDGEKVEHSDFGTGSVTVTIPLDSFGDLTGKMVKVWYLSGDEPEEMEAIFDNNAKKVKFLTHHFSEYKIEVVDVEPETPVEPVLYGDLDGDKEITINDALILQRYIAKLSTEIDKIVADVDGDNEVTVNDALLIQRYVAKLIEAFPCA